MTVRSSDTVKQVQGGLAECSIARYATDSLAIARRFQNKGEIMDNTDEIRPRTNLLVLCLLLDRCCNSASLSVSCLVPSSRSLKLVTEK